MWKLPEIGHAHIPFWLTQALEQDRILNKANTLDITLINSVPTI